MSTASIEWRKPAALLLALAATGGVALGARCGSATQARCSIASLTGNAPKLDVPYAGTRPEVVRLMLDMAGVRAGERVLDLGTGDGRILLAAAERGAGGLGVDIDPVLLDEAKAEATRRGLDGHVRFEAQDLFRTPLRDVDVLTMFLLPEVNLKLRPRILAEMRPGARVVSHAFDMGDWSPDSRGRAGGARVYLWRVPARIEGEWRLSEPGKPSTRLVLRQRHQALAGSLDGETIGDARVDGARVTFSVSGRRFSGVAGDRGIVAEPGTGGWRARLTAVGPGEVGP